MMFDNTNNNIIVWTLGIIIAVPLITIVLGEVIDRLRSRDNHYARFFEIIRTLLLPSIVTFVLAKFLFQLDIAPAEKEAVTGGYFIYMIILSVLYVSIAHAAFIFLRTLKYETNPDAWENRIPGLFKAIFTLMIFIIPTLLLLKVWGIEVGNFAKYASITAAAIAFALQDALSSITKGFLLVLDKPFEVGDWIEVNGIKGKVTDISWRSTRIRVNGNDIVVIPNLIISDNSVYNYTAENISYRDRLTVGFSYDDPPNKVKEIMMGVLLDCPDVMKLPRPRIYTISYDDFSISYRLYFYVENYVSNLEQERVRDAIMSRVWYAADRGGLSIPFPIQVEGPPSTFKPDPSTLKVEIYDFLYQNHYFSCLPKETLHQLAMATEIVPFATGETVFKENEISDALSIVRKGEIRLHYHDADPENNTEYVRKDDLIGVMSLLGKRTNLSTAHATKDTEVLKFKLTTLEQIIASNPKFARRLNTLIETRMLQAKKGQM
jgi:small-conductance mechanosensitive channel